MTKSTSIRSSTRRKKTNDVQPVIEKIQAEIVECVDRYELEVFHDEGTIASLREELTQLVWELLQPLKTYRQNRRLCRIHVSQPAIRKNQKDLREGTGDGYEPVITCKRGKTNTYGHQVDILDNVGNVVATVVQPQDKTLNCGARVWVETRNPVRVQEFSRKETGTVQTDLPR